jgi:hypothetical protein
VRLKSYATTTGFQPVSIGMSICAATVDTGTPRLEAMIKAAKKELDESVRTESIMVHHFKTE